MTRGLERDIHYCFEQHQHFVPPALFFVTVVTVATATSLAFYCQEPLKPGVFDLSSRCLSTLKYGSQAQYT